MNHIGVRDLHKLSEKAIGELVGTAHVQFGGRTIALLIPLKQAAPSKAKQAKRCEPGKKKGPRQI